MIIRPAHQTDAEAIAKVQVDTWRSTYKGIMSDDFLAALSYEQRAKAWHNILSDPKPNQFAYVAMQDAKEVIAFAVGAIVIAFLRSDLIPTMLFGALSFTHPQIGKPDHASGAKLVPAHVSSPSRSYASTACLTFSNSSSGIVSSRPAFRVSALAVSLR